MPPTLFLSTEMNRHWCGPSTMRCYLLPKKQARPTVEDALRLRADAPRDCG